MERAKAKGRGVGKGVREVRDGSDLRLKARKRAVSHDEIRPARSVARKARVEAAPSRKTRGAGKAVAASSREHAGGGRRRLILKRMDLSRFETSPAVKGLLFGLLIAFSIAGYVRSAVGGNLGSDAALGAALSAEDAVELGDLSLALIPPSVKGENPWAGAGRRARGDMIVAQAGCGGEVRPAARNGDRVHLRYLARKGGKVFDSTRGVEAVDVVLGARQAGPALDAALVGLCAGEAVLVHAPGGMDLVIAVLGVGRNGGALRGVNGTMGDSAEAKADRLAREVVAVAGRKGASCDKACGGAGLVCVEDGFAIVNTCPRLRKLFTCVDCEVAAAGTAGPDMPCFVSANAPVGHPRGFCMVHPTERASRCEAKYAHTQRICPCLDGALEGKGA